MLSCVCLDVCAHNEEWTMCVCTSIKVLVLACLLHVNNGERQLCMSFVILVCVGYTVGVHVGVGGL